MAQRAIREYEGKRIFHNDWSRHFGQFRYTFQAASVASGEELIALAAGGDHHWHRFMTDPGMFIPGIGHRLKAARNSDLCIEGLKRYADPHFPAPRRRTRTGRAMPAGDASVAGPG